MVVDDQRAVIDFLSSPAAYAGYADVEQGGPVERMETHSAVVFLAGRRAWKLKRAVLFDYLDFSTVERRRLMCEAEVRLNRRTAPGIYRGVVPVARGAHDALVLGGSGPVVDWLVEMNRFDQRELGDRRAAEGSLDIALMERLATSIAAFHREAQRRDDHGGRDAMRWVVDGNAAGCVEFGSAFLDGASIARVTQQARAAVQAHALLLDTRRDAGFVRQCHGDLHLRNIVIIDGQPTLFDAVEFNDELACIDVVYDVAFLLMDLLKRQLPQHASVVFNRYLAETDDLDALPLMPLFLSCRAAIRAKTSATAASLQSEDHRRRELQDLSRQYLEMSERLLHPHAPVMIAVGGLSGTGKSTVAAHLAPSVGPPPGAVVLRSDEIRKELCGVPRLSRLSADGYTPDVSARVYAALAARAARVLRAGHSVIVDAVAARLRDREALERVAAEAHVPFAGYWLDAPVSTLIERTSRRHDDVSDADAAVVRMQLREPVGPMRWRRIDATPPAETVVRAVTATLPQAEAASVRTR